ncbi:cyclin-D1-1-like [Zingiber officinale]|uniref:cyclin-D1-1-like n=1 Tax=Zingiber officinale TaxID=94328 RepID=UPI001C4C9806|nr:cyclin-D1-1-like [Zingiber officinale]
MPPSPSASSVSSGCFDADELAGFHDDSAGSLAVFVDGESEAEGEADSARLASDSLDPAARRAVVKWILKVRAYYQFRPLTAYLAVIYVNRFLSSHRLQRNGWALQLLSVACLSLAVKMEETLAPTLLDLQVEGAKFIFKPHTVLRMELLVLTGLDWRLRAVTPFSFTSFFAFKIDPSGKRAEALVSKATQFILSAMQEIDVTSHSPSALAASATIFAVEEIHDLAIVTPTIAASWCPGLTEERISNCNRMLQRVVDERRLRKSPIILSQHRVTSSARRDSGTSSLPTKKRKHNSHSCD